MDLQNTILILSQYLYVQKSNHANLFNIIITHFTNCCEIGRSLFSLLVSVSSTLRPPPQHLDHASLLKWKYSKAQQKRHVDHDFGCFPLSPESV